MPQILNIVYFCLSLSLFLFVCVCFTIFFDRILPIKRESLFLCLNWLWILVDINETKSNYMATEQQFSPPITRNTLSFHRIVPIFFGNSVIVSFALYSVRFCSFCQFVLIFYSTLFIFLSLIFKHFFYCIFFFYLVQWKFLIFILDETHTKSAEIVKHRRAYNTPKYFSICSV